MSKRVRIEVVPRPLPPNWAVTIDGIEVSRRFSQKSAVAVARRVGRAIKRGLAELVIKGRNGEISEKETYGRDPRTTRG